MVQHSLLEVVMGSIVWVESPKFWLMLWMEWRQLDEWSWVPLGRRGF